MKSLYPFVFLKPWMLKDYQKHEFFFTKFIIYIRIMKKNVCAVLSFICNLFLISVGWTSLFQYQPIDPKRMS